MSDRPALYEFDRFTVDASQRLLFSAGRSDPVELPPRAFEALLYLVERPGQLLTKQELLKALWPKVLVEENSLNQVISLLRKVLGERPSEHRYIVTAPGRGYRFVAAVRTLGAGHDAQPTGEDLSLAVLPFADHTVGLGRGYLGDAIAADLIRLLSARSRIRVAAHTSSAVYKDRSMDMRVIAKTLNVARVVEGQVTNAGEQLIVTARLIDGTSGVQTRSATERRHVRDLAELQMDLARQIALALNPNSGAMLGGCASAEPQAYLHYLHALSLSMTPKPERVIRSIALLQEALRYDPFFSRAKSLLAIQYTACVMFGVPIADALDRARHEVAGALALDDQNGETHCAAAVIDCLSGAWARAEERFLMAHSLTADPLVSGLRCAYLSLSVGQLERAMQQAEHALRVAPTHPIGVCMMATLNMTKGNNEQALRYAQLAVELGQPPSTIPLADILAGLAMRAGYVEEATRHIKAVFPPRVDVTCLSRVTQRLHSPSPSCPERDKGFAALRALEESLSADELDPPMRKRFLLWYSSIGALDRAFELASESLDNYAREGTVGGAWGVLWLPEMAAFRHDRRFRLFAQRLRLFEYWSEYGPPDGYCLHGDRLTGTR
jgi:DNA-binding winged helix-turn-helix (wHTH) protein